MRVVTQPGLRIIFDGLRNGHPVVFLCPQSAWGDLPYSLETIEGGYAFDPSEPHPGDRLHMVVSDRAYRILRDERSRRT